MKKCPRCKGKFAYLEYGQGRRRDGTFWRYRQKFCSNCSYIGTRRYTFPIKEAK